LITLISEEKKTGLILVSGAMGTGKTTTAAAIVSEKIKKSGLLGVAIEDPIETLLCGLHGTGRCIQLEVSENEDYSLALKRSMRMGANILFIGEIRDAITAHEALKASLNGAFVVATLHAASVMDAIERYSMLCNEMHQHANPIIAKSLFMVTHQRLKEVNRDDKVVTHHVSLEGYHIQSVAAIKAKIKDGNFGSLI
ncbi:Type II secretory pathway, ATPase PulE/Tfp pilus assembly pathway, ATPase PilB, partial [Candidatus Regiella insecticola 5.15]